MGGGNPDCICVVCNVLREVFIAYRAYDVRVVILQLDRCDLDFLNVLQLAFPLRGRRGFREDVIEVGDA